MTDLKRRIVLVGCGAAKRDEPARADDLYTSTYFGLKRRYAEQIGDTWYVLSAEHGLISPARLIEPYDTSIEDVDTDRWMSEDVLPYLLAYLSGSTTPADPDEIVVEILAGKGYADPVQEAVEQRSIEVRRPFDGTAGIGEQMQLLSEAIEP